MVALQKENDVLTQQLKLAQEQIVSLRLQLEEAKAAQAKAEEVATRMRAGDGARPGKREDGRRKSVSIGWFISITPGNTNPARVDPSLRCHTKE